jgi:riboflavin kinase/FMN adenylyltransferase
MRGMTNVGFRPTFHGERMTLETHFLDGIGDIYDSSIRIHFIDRLRDECSFESAEALVRQIEHDRIQAEQILKTYQI